MHYGSLRLATTNSPFKYGSPNHGMIIVGLLSRDRHRIITESKKGSVSCSWPPRSSVKKPMEMMMTMSGCVKRGSEETGCLVSEHGWKVRRLAVGVGVEMSEEMRRASEVQAEAFHVPAPLFNDLFFQFFQAEVLSGLLYKLRNSPPNRYTCLVAKPSAEPCESQEKVVGVVDLTVLDDKLVLQHLQGAEEYLYVSGMAVLNNHRRQKVATVLLKACDMISLQWGYEYLVLRAYEDDWGARKLYTNAGYKVVSGDPLWMTTWIGRKRRVLMVKRSSLSKLHIVDLEPLHLCGNGWSNFLPIYATCPKYDHNCSSCM